MKHIIVITPIKHLNDVNDELKKHIIYYKPDITSLELNSFLINNLQIEYIFTNPNKQGFKLNENNLKNTNIKYINTASTGLNHIDLEYCNINNIQVLSLTTDYELINNLPSTSELAFGLMISLLRNINTSFNSVKKYNWNYEPFIGRQIKNLTIGIIGFGRLGKIMANFCYQFGMNVLVYDPYINSINNYKKVNYNELLINSDVISLHVHVNDSTKYMINNDVLQKMKNNSYIINTSRGEIVNENDIITYLKNNKLAGYATDVIEDEFNNIKNSELIKFCNSNNYNIIITPHVGGMTIEGQNKAFLWAAKKFNYLN